MKVLIGITTRNRSAILPKAIESALAQTYAAKEVAVFDDGSTDETPSLRQSFPQVKWYESTEHIGLINARNKLMQETDADYYLSLDDDAWFIAGDEIEQGIRLMEAHPDTAAIAFDILSPDRAAPNPRQAPYQTHLFIGCGHILRLSAVKEIGYYSSSHGFYGCEEKDLSIRLLDKGYKITFLPGVHVWHDKTVLARNAEAQHQSGVFNDLVFTFRRTPTLLLPAILTYRIVTHLQFARKRQLMKPCLGGISSFFSAIPKIYTTVQPVGMKAFFEFKQLSQKKL